MRADFKRMMGKEKRHTALRAPPPRDGKAKGFSRKSKAPGKDFCFVLPLFLVLLATRWAARGGFLLDENAWETKLSAVFWIRSFAVLSLFAAGTAAVAENNPLTAQVRAANDRFKDVAIAVKEGYEPIPCASGIDGGAMGVHYVKASLIGETVDIKQPQAVMYEPKPDGKMELIAVEYITTKGPASLGGQLFNFTGSPNRYGLPPFYELHVWAWKANARGAFSDMNPSVSCEHAHAMK